jgi:hypothetical protein
MKILDLSREELASFVTWFNKFYGYYPVIIGGWAVYYYNNYLMSKDIDVVFEARLKTYDTALLQYLVSNGYSLYNKEKWGMTKTFRKAARTNGDEYFIDIDACSIYDSNIYHRNNKLHLPYSLTSKNSILMKDSHGGKEIDYRIPTIELLFLFKLKAYSDRDFDLQSSTSSEDILYLTSKRNKDGSDIIALIDPKHCKEKIDYTTLAKLAKSLNLLEETVSTLRQIIDNDAPKNSYRRLPPHESTKLLETAVKNISNEAHLDISTYLEVK